MYPHSCYFIFQVTFVIFSFLTNLIVDALTESCEDGDIQQVLSDLLSGEGGIYQFCASFPNVRMFLAFPNIRLKPSWYCRNRSAIVRTLHQFMEKSPLNLQLLEDFSGELCSDQIHFSVLSGMGYVKHLVDRSLELMTQPAPSANQR